MEPVYYNIIIDEGEESIQTQIYPKQKPSEKVLKRE